MSQQYSGRQGREKMDKYYPFDKVNYTEREIQLIELKRLIETLRVLNSWKRETLESQLRF